VQELGGSIARQIAKLANGNVPYHRCHAYEWGLARGQESALLVSMSLNPLLSTSFNFSVSLFFLKNFAKFARKHDFRVPQSLLLD